MELKQQLFIIKGMLRDLSVSKFNPDYAYENMNIRITAKENNSLLSVTNEKGNKEVVILNKDGEPLIIEGTYLGSAILNNIIILFTTIGSTDRIYRLFYNQLDNSFKGGLLFKGGLNFNELNPIETICVFENEDIQKVYWVDGINQPRVANIAESFDVTKYVNTSFDFAQNIELKEEIVIDRNLVSSGTFSPGVIQYAFSYYNKYAQETAIFHTSPLNYTSYKDRGAGPDDKVSNSFNIKIKQPDRSFEYVRIYSIHRTSLDAVPTAKRVADLAIGKTGEIYYIDNGSSGDIIDSTELLFKGSDNMVVGTMAHKDNTLFLGNIKLKLEMIPSTLKTVLLKNHISFIEERTGVMTPEPKGYYPYESTLKYDSQTIKTFKYLDHYRFGVQFQHESGRWSEAIYLKDVLNTIPIKASFNSVDEVKLTQAKYILSQANINTVLELGFVRARGIVSYPDISDREVIAQGILSPTVFNVLDRHTNSPFSQASWFTRPNAPFHNYGEWDGLTLGSWVDIDDPLKHSLNSRAGFFDMNTNKSEDGTVLNIDSVIHGSLSEFRHFRPLPDNRFRNSEIQCNHDVDNLKPLLHPFTEKTTAGDVSRYVSDNADRFFVDQSIFTFHSPELEFDESLKSMDSNNLKLRIVGMVPITSNVSDVDIITSTALFNEDKLGFYKEIISNKNISRIGAKGLNSAVLWIDSLVKGKDLAESGATHHFNKESVGFLVYPWHRNGSLNNDSIPEEGKKRTALLDKKKMSNLRFSYGTHYYEKNELWNAYEVGNDLKTGVSGVEIFDSNEITLIKLPAPKNSNLDAINYYGNVDKVVTSKKYPIVGTTGDNLGNSIIVYDNARLFRKKPIVFKETLTQIIKGSEPVRIKYKSTPHAVMALNYTVDGQQKILPTIEDTEPLPFFPELTATFGVNRSDMLDLYTGKPFWDTEINDKNVVQDVLDSPLGGGNTHNIGHGFLWLAELYNDDIVNRFGGTSKEAIENNLWVPCGSPVSLVDKTSVDILYTEGDTFYGRYDCLKTYPSTLEDLNSVVDIVSFMVESRVNLDGRYDRNRGQLSNLTMNPTNFNKMNPVYSLNNNFFNYRSLNEERFLLNDFRNSVVWSKGKTLGELTDTWTNINLTSTIDLDGDKGPINALTRFKNEIIAFQDKGISRILFNSRVLVNASDGVPIEISNSYKVDGKVYIDEVLGCTNKWSIKNTKSGLYFNDDLSKGIYNFNGETFTDVTSKLGFNTYYNDISSLEKWNAANFNNSITFYDGLNGDVYFVNKDRALSYSEKIGQFTSFYNYEETPLMFNIGDGSFAFKGNKIWKQFDGEYNNFFGVTKPYYVTVIANLEPTLDKTYTNLEFRADTWDGKVLLDEVTFDKLEIWNEYQHGELSLYMTKNRLSPLKKRFRMWNVELPRDKVFRRDRIRNPWAYLKLSMDDPKNYRTELHDIVINYFA